MEYNSVLKLIGDFGRIQKIYFFLLCVIILPNALYNLGYMFWAARMEHWCHVTGLDHLTNLTSEEKMALTIPIAAKGSSHKYSQCYMYNRAYENISLQEAYDLLNKSHSDVSTKKCSTWDYDTSVFESSIVSQWNLVCDRKWLISTSQMVYMAGMLIGSCSFGYLGDRFGRQKSLSVSVIGNISCSIIAIFSPNYIFFLVVRVIWSITAVSAYVLIFVLCMELVGSSWRVQAGWIVPLFYAFGYMAVCAIAYFIRNHTKLQLVLYVPWVLLIIILFIIPESPRWLLVTGRQERARNLLRKMARSNKVTLPDDLQITVKEKSRTKEGNVLDLFRTTHLRRKTFILLFTWFACSIGYYGISVNSNVLPGSNYYLNNFMFGAVEVPSCLLGMFSQLKLGRRWPMAVSLVTAAASLLLMMAVPEG